MLMLQPVSAQDKKPDPELLEMLGGIGNIEDMGVDVERMITDRLQQRPENDIQESNE